MSVLRCESCAHWRPATDRLTAYAGACALQSYTGRVPFDMSCDKHSSAPQPPPVPDMQSQARGFPVPMFAWGAKKP